MSKRAKTAGHGTSEIDESDDDWGNPFRHPGIRRITRERRITPAEHPINRALEPHLPALSVELLEHRLRLDKFFKRK